MLDDLQRPLGRDLPRRSIARRRPVGARALPLAALTLILAGSAATVLLQPDFRSVDVFEEAASAEAAREAERVANAAVAVLPAAPMAPSPKIFAAPLPDPDLPTITYPPGQTGRAGQMISVSDPSSLRQPLALAASPDETLLEPSDVGPLPVRAGDGRRPFDVYSAEAASSLGTRVAIVVGGLGISQTGSQAAIAALPQGVTLAFAPSGNSLDRWMKEARRDGHELLLQAPMEPFGYPQSSPGPHTVTAEDIAAGDLGELHWSLGRLTNYVGVMNYMGARVTADPAVMQPFLAELSRRGLMFLDDSSSARSVARDAARETGAVFGASDVLIDASQDRDAIVRQLDTLERVARAEGSAIGIASAFDTSVAAIAQWIEAAEARGIKVVPVSALASDPESR